MATLSRLMVMVVALLLGLFLFFSPPAIACDSRDKAALLSIKAGFLNASKFSFWNDSTACCTWYGVYCFPFNASHRVTALGFYNNDGPNDGLFGRLPDALGDLPFLSTLHLGNHPNLYGALPQSLTRLRSLSVLSLPQNSLSGNIPSFLSQLLSLSTLDLSSNKFSGAIPPELSALPVLQSLSLEDNSLEGGIPTTFGNFNKSSPPNLILSHNRLSGNIPAELGVVDWVILDFSHNKLTGNPSTVFGEKKRADSIDLSYNQLEFDMSTVNFPLNLTTLHLNMNKITGSIPAKINQLSKLVNFNVSYNELCGIIPAGMVMDRFDDRHFFPNKCLCRSKDSCL